MAKSVPCAALGGGGGLLAELRALTAEARGKAATDLFEVYVERIKREAALGKSTIWFNGQSLEGHTAELIELFRAAGFFVAGRPDQSLQVSWAPPEPAAPSFRDFD